MKAKLTDIQVQKIPFPETGAIEVVDEGAPGLVLRITASKQKSWMVRYTPKGGKQRRVAIGRYPSMKLAAARVEAREFDHLARLGRDRQKEREEGQREAARADRTFGAMLNAYVVEHCQKNQRAWRHTQRMFEIHVFNTKLAKRPLAEIRRADIIELLQGLLGRGLKAQVNRIHAQIKAAFNWAIEREWVEANPAQAIKRQYAHERPRDRVLTPDELKALWTVADKLTEPSRTLVKVWMLTGQRRDEVRCMRWSEINLEAGIWTIPGERTKNHRPHALPLPPAVLDLIEAMPKVGGEYVFTTDGEKPYAGQKRLKDILDREAGSSEWAHWTFHDFRRTVATGMANLGVRDEVIARVLNHARHDVTSIHYNKHDYMNEKLCALQAWASCLLGVVGSGAHNVVPIRGARRRP